MEQFSTSQSQSRASSYIADTYHYDAELSQLASPAQVHDKELNHTLHKRSSEARHDSASNYTAHGNIF